MIEHPLQSFLHLRRSRLDILRIWSGGVSRHVDLGLTAARICILCDSAGWEMANKIEMAFLDSGCKESTCVSIGSCAAQTKQASLGRCLIRRRT